MAEQDEQQTDRLRPVSETRLQSAGADQVEESAQGTSDSTPHLSSVAVKIEDEPAQAQEQHAPAEDFGGFELSEAANAPDPYVPAPSQPAPYPPSPVPDPYSYAPGQALPPYGFMPGQPPYPYAYMPAPAVKAPLYFPLTRRAPLSVQWAGMLLYSLLIALSFMGIALYLVNASYGTTSIFTFSDGGVNVLAILLVVALAFLVIPAGSLLAGALFGSWRGLLVSLAALGGGLLITHLSNNDFFRNFTVSGLLPLCGLPLSAFVVGLFYDFRKYAAWWKSMLVLMLGAGVASTWLFTTIVIMDYALSADAALSSNPQAFMLGIWIANICLSLVCTLALTFPSAGIEGLIHWRVAAAKRARRV